MKNVTFYMQVYHDFERAKWATGHLRKQFPDSRLIIFSDGDDDPRFQELPGEVHYGERLYPLQNGGKLVHRMLEVFLERPSDYLFKVDTDSGFHRPFKHFPKVDCYFGTVQHHTTNPSIQGGCAGFTLNVARMLYESKICLSDQLLDYKNSWAKCRACAASAERRGNISTDWLTGYCAGQLGIPLQEYREVSCRHRGRPSYKPRQFAITHEHKDMVL